MIDPTLPQIRQIKSDLEAALLALIADKLSDFHEQTGVSIESIYVSREPIQNLPDATPTHYVTTKVELYAEI